MRVAFLLDRWHPRGGGLEEWLRAVAPALAARGHEPWLIARGASQQTPVGVRALDAGSKLPLLRPWRDRRDAHARTAAMRRVRPDAVLDLRASLCGGAIWFAMGGFGTLREGATSSGRRRALLRLEEESLRLAAAAIAPSPAVARALQAYAPELAVRVLPLPLLAPPTRAHGPDAEALAGRRALRVMFCGRDPERHGLAEAALWVEALRARYARVEWDVWTKEGVPVPGARLHAWDGSFRAALAHADLLLHPTAYDSFSLVCLEAAAAGVPVVTTAQAGVAELLPPELCVTAPRGAPNEAAWAADRVLRAAAERSPQERERLRAELSELFSLKRHVTLLLELFAAYPWIG